MRKKKSSYLIMSCSTNTDLPTEMDPRSWNVTDQSMACSSKIPINTAFDSLNACYKTGTDLDSCAASTGYRDTFLNYQNCLAGDTDGTTYDDDTCMDDTTNYTPAVKIPTATGSGTGMATTSTSQTTTGSEVSWIPMSIESLITFICGMVNTVMLTIVVYIILRRRTSV